MVYLYVGIAGFFGAILRYVISLVILYENVYFPYATLFVNLLGSFLFAILTSAVFEKFRLSSNIRIALTTGFFGSFTTFSALSIETVFLFQHGYLFSGIIYIFISLLGGWLMVYLGLLFGKRG